MLEVCWTCVIPTPYVRSMDLIKRSDKGLGVRTLWRRGYAGLSNG